MDEVDARVAGTLLPLLMPGDWEVLAPMVQALVRRLGEPKVRLIYEALVQQRSEQAPSLPPAPTWEEVSTET